MQKGGIVHGRFFDCTSFGRVNEYSRGVQHPGDEKFRDMECRCVRAVYSFAYDIGNLGNDGTGETAPGIPGGTKIHVAWRRDRSVHYLHGDTEHGYSGTGKGGDADAVDQHQDRQQQSRPFFASIHD